MRVHTADGAACTCDSCGADIPTLERKDLMIHIRIGDTGQFTANAGTEKEVQAALVIAVNQADDTVNLVTWNDQGATYVRHRADVTIKPGTPGAFLLT